MIPYKDLPAKIKAYGFHGFHVDELIDSDRGMQARGACLLCGAKGKFFANAENQLWDCKVCGERGNLQQFLMLISERNKAIIKGKSKALKDLADNRGLLPSTLNRWGIGWDGQKYSLPIPYMGDSGREDMLNDLRHYVLGDRLINTPTAKHGLFGLNRLQKSGPIYYMEGEWDAMALDECLRRTKSPGSALAGTGGANTFKPEWAGYFRGRDVILCYDNDLAGIQGENRAFEILRPAARTIKLACWNPKLEEGYDFRDFYGENGRNAEKALDGLKSILKANPRPLPAKPGKSPQRGLQADSAPDPGPVLDGPGMPWPDVVKGYRKWLEMPSEEPLLVVLAVCMANRLLGDPLWLFLIAPPGGSKSEILMSLDSSDLIISLSQLTPHALISGQKIAKGQADPSLLPRLNNRLLIIKDFTTIIGMNENNREDILSQLRDAYDGKAEKFFGTGDHKTYRSRFGIVAGVTPAIEKFSANSVSLGERFLKYKIKMPGQINVGTRQIMRAIQNTGREGRMREELQEIGKAALDHFVDSDNPPSLPQSLVPRILALAQLIAALRGAVPRARYTNEVEFLPTSEVGTRLAKQFTKLGMGLSLVKFEDEISEESFRTILNVARDTVPDRVEKIVQCLFLRTDMHKKGAKGDKITATTDQLSQWTRLPHSTMTFLLQDLVMLGIVEKYTEQDGKAQINRWKLRPMIKRLIESTGIYQDMLNWAERSKLDVD